MKLIHLKKHLSYYIIIHKLKSIPLCKHCKINNTKYQNLTRGYYDYCSNSCQVSSDETQLKLKKFNIDKYGVDHYTKTEEFKESFKKIRIDKQIGFEFDKFKNTIKEKYGVNNISSLESISLKKRETWLSNYENLITLRNSSIKSVQSKKIKNDIIITENLNNNSIIFKFSEKDTICAYCLQCEKDFNILKQNYQNRLKYNKQICTICNPNVYNSNPENEILAFIKENYNNEIISKDRKILNGKEIDIYLPDIQFGIEFHGLWWHSEKYRLNDNHLNKYLLAKLKNINLIQIYTDDWINKKDIVKSIIFNKLNININEVDAINCTIKELSNNDVINFLDVNDIHGYISSFVNIGLFLNNELISLITFSENNINNEYEILRCCNKLNYNIINGFNTVLLYFISKYNPTIITHLSDNFYYSGELYEKNNFKFISEINPIFYYTNGTIRKSSFLPNINSLVKHIDDDKLEKDIMNDLGWYKIYNAGYKKYIYNVTP